MFFRSVHEMPAGVPLLHLSPLKLEDCKDKRGKNKIGIINPKKKSQCICKNKKYILIDIATFFLICDRISLNLSFIS